MANQTPRKRRASALSLRKVHNKLTDIDSLTSEEDYSNKPKDAFTNSQLVEKWSYFGNKLKADGELNLSSIVNANQPTLDKNTITFALPNTIMEEQFGNVKSRLLNFLRKEFNNYSITIQTIVVKSHQKKYIYTPQEKFNKLVESNPNVLLLKNKFGLNI